VVLGAGCAEEKDEKVSDVVRKRGVEGDQVRFDRVRDYVSALQGEPHAWPITSLRFSTKKQIANRREPQPMFLRE
jgi:hypothetical protein